MRSLRNEWRSRSSEPAAATADLRSEFHAVHKRIKQISRQQGRLTKARLQHKESASFRSDPFKYGRRTFRPQTTTKPDFDANEAMKYFRSVYTDPRREFQYEPYEHLGEPPSTHFVASTCPPSFAEFSAVIRSRRNSSAPGPNGIPYTVWKRCPNLQMRLFSIISRAWKSTEIPPSWQQAVIRLVHKSGSPSEPSNFRPIALTNCDGKIFFALVAKSALKHMTKNSFFDLRLQKGFLPGVSGCIEHTSLISEALRDARSHQRSICVSWLDLRNAFGSVRHSLIQFALRHYGFPRHFQQLVFRYYESLVAMVEVPDVFQTSPFHFGIGVFQGCTLSPLLFNIVIQLLLDSLEKPAFQPYAYRFSSVQDCSLLSSAYADDVELVTCLPEENQALLDRTEHFLKWTETMETRPKKCWSLALKRFASRDTNEGESLYRRFNPNLNLSGRPLCYLDDGDFRYLGRPTNAAGCEKTTRNEITATLERLLQQVDALHLPSTCKLWLYQHFVVTKLCWFFTALDLSQTFVKSLQSKATKFLKSWSGLPRSANTTILFLGKSGRTGLHVTNLVTYWKQMQLVRMDILKRSADPRCNRVYDALLKRQTSWLRKYPPAVEHACATTVVDSNPDRESLGHEPLRSKSKTVNKQPSNRKRVLKWAYDIDVEEQLAKLRRLEVQNRWLEWTDVMNADLTWRRLIFGMSDNELKFTLQAITNTAPTPDNLRRWNCAQIDSSCTLCGRPCTLRHVLNSCSVSLHQGRYSWRHNAVLSVLKRHLLKFWDHVVNEARSSDAPFIRLVPEHAASFRPHSSDRSRRPLFSSDALRCASDWVFLFDLEDALIFPPEIAATLQRPDIVIFSRALRQVILIELTVPLEDRVCLAHERKRNRYLPLLSLCQSNGWNATHFPVEVGSRGFVAYSLMRCLTQLGFPSYWAKKVRNEASKVSLRCSYLIYLRRNIRVWQERLGD